MTKKVKLTDKKFLKTVDRMIKEHPEIFKAFEIYDKTHKFPHYLFKKKKIIKPKSLLKKQ